MISYAPFEVDERPQVVEVAPRQPVEPKRPEKKVVFGEEGTECNWLIFVFIIGLLYIISTE